MASFNRQGKLSNYVNYRLRVNLIDGRQMTGQMLAFDNYMNLVLADAEEFRTITRKGKGPPGSNPASRVEEKRTLGLVILRGQQVLSTTVEGDPPADPSARLGQAPAGSSGIPPTMAAGPGISRPAGRGAMPNVPGGLSGPAPGMGMGASFAPGPPGFPGRGMPGGPGHFPPPGFPQGGPPPPGGAPPGMGRQMPPGFGGPR